MGGYGAVARQESNAFSAEAAVRAEFNKLIADASCVTLNSGALAITGGGSTTAKVVNQVDVIINGVVSSITAATNMAALAGTITQNNFGGWVFTINAAGTLASRFMTQGASLAAVKMPAIPAGEAIIGYVRLNPTAANFVGATTALDAASTNAIYKDGPMSRVAISNSADTTATGQAGQVTSPVG